MATGEKRERDQRRGQVYEEYIAAEGVYIFIELLYSSGECI